MNPDCRQQLRKLRAMFEEHGREEYSRMVTEWNLTPRETRAIQVVPEKAFSHMAAEGLILSLSGREITRERVAQIVKKALGKLVRRGILQPVENKDASQ